MGASKDCRGVRGRFHCVLLEEQTSHPLHLGISKDDMRSIIAEDVDDGAVLALSCGRAGNFLTGNGFLLVWAEPLVLSPEHSERNEVQSPPLGADSSHVVTLHSTQTFLTHYGFSVKDTVTVKAVRSFPVTKVVMGAKTEKAFEWAKERIFSTSLLLSVCQKPVLVRQNDVLLAPYSSLLVSDPHVNHYFDLVTLECEPVLQGILTVNTKIVLVKLTDESSQPQRTEIIQHENEDMLFLPAILSDFAHFQSLDCANSVLTLEMGQEKTPQGGPQTAKQPISSNKPVIVKVVSNYATWDNMWTSESQNSFDDHSVIGMNICAMKKLGFFDGSLACISLFLEHETRDPEERKLDQNPSLLSLQKGQIVQDGSMFLCPPKTNAEDSELTIKKQNKHKKRKKPSNLDPDTGMPTRIVQVRLVKENASSQNEECLYMLPTLWFNLVEQPCSLQDCVQVVVKKHSSINCTADHSVSVSWSQQLAYAVELHIALVYSPDYNATCVLNTVLRKHFTCPRIITTGDILCMHTKDDPEFFQSVGDGTEAHYPVVYFQVTKLVSPDPGYHTCLVDTANTTLFQDGVVHSYVPTVMNFLHHPDSRVSGSSPKSPPGLSGYVTKIADIIQPHLKPRPETRELNPSILFEAPSGSGKTSVLQAVASQLGMHFYKINGYELCGETSAATEARIKTTLTRAVLYAPCIALMTNIHVLGKDRDGRGEDSRVAAAFTESICKLGEDSPNWPVVIVATTSNSRLVSSEILQCFLHHVKLEVPNEDTRAEMLRILLSAEACSRDLSVKHIAQRTAGMVLGDLEALVSHAKREAYMRVRQVGLGNSWHLWGEEEHDLCMAGCHLQEQDFDQALDCLQAAHSDAIGAPKIPNVTWDDVGGLADVKADILDTIQLPLQHPQLFAAGLRRSGVLLYGPPGTGKTLLAKAVATECSLNFLSVKGPELINMYVGQSEENVREVFHRARSASPCVIFFDELDSLAPNRGRTGDSGGVMDRVVSQLLAELDGLHKSCDVFVIGATNRPDLLDPALLRPGRFDKLLYLGVSDTCEAQMKVMKALTRKFHLAEDCHLENIVEQCGFNLTGADFYAVCSDAMLNALKRKIDLLQAGEEVDQNKVEVQEQDFTKAIQNLVPSVSETDIQYYRSLQMQLNNHKLS